MGSGLLVPVAAARRLYTRSRSTAGHNAMEMRETNRIPAKAMLRGINARALDPEWRELR